MTFEAQTATIMGPAIFIIAIMGCGEGDQPCQQISALETRYESRTACAAATEAALANVEIDFPLVAAECVPAGAPFDPPPAGEIERPGPGMAELESSPVRS